MKPQLNLCYDVSVRLSVRLPVTEVHWRIIANLGFKFRSHFTAHCPGGRAARRAACGRIISRHAGQCQGSCFPSCHGFMCMYCVQGAAIMWKASNITAAC